MRIYSDCVFGAVGAQLFDEFIVEAEDQEDWSPLANEERPVIRAQYLEEQRSSDGSHGGPKKGIRRQFGGLIFDRLRDGSFGVFFGIDHG